MNQAPRSSRRQLEEEVAALRRRVAELERDRGLAERMLHGDPARSNAPLLAQVPAILWLTDTSLRLRWWTGGGIDALGVDATDWIGVDIYTFLHTDDPNHPSVAAHDAALRGEPSSFEVEREGRFGSAHVAPHHGADGSIIGVVGVSIDVTSRVLAERELRSALARVNLLSGLVPICMHCKDVRDDAGYWQQVETWVRDHSGAEFTHAICPDCMKQKLADPRDARGARRP